MNLPYIGLQGPAGAACQPKETKSKRDILKEYRRAGYGPKELAMVKSELMTAKSVKKSKHGYLINGILFSLGNKSKGLNFGGYGGSGDFGGGSGAGQGTGVPGNGGLPTDGQGQSDITWDDVKEMWQDVKEIFSWLKGVVDWITGITSGCNNATWPPEDAEADVKRESEKFQELFETLRQQLNAGNINSGIVTINKASKRAYGYRNATIKAAEEGRFHKCSKESALKIFKPAREKFIQLVEKTGKKFFGKVGYDIVFDHMEHVNDAGGYSYKVYKAVKQTAGTGTGAGTGAGTAPAGQKKSALPLLGLLTAGYFAFK